MNKNKNLKNVTKRQGICGGWSCQLAAPSARRKKFLTFFTSHPDINVLQEESPSLQEGKDVKHQLIYNIITSQQFRSEDNYSFFYYKF